MPEDIRDKLYLNHDEILGLNFIRAPGVYFYRRHCRAGLRSHILQVLDPEDLEREKEGIIIDGLRWFPRAKPLKILRIFKRRFDRLEVASEEIERVRIIETYLSPDYLARSDEFLVDYTACGRPEPLLCGLQEYVEGEILDPFGHLDRKHLVSMLQHMGFLGSEGLDVITDRWILRVRREAEKFIGKLKKMILEANHAPDLAGTGNLLLTRFGHIKLVDINNISRVSFDQTIKLDDRGYPVSDKSIEALSLLEEKLLGRCIHRDEVIYKTFLDPERMKDVKAAEEEFYLRGLK